MAGNIACEWTAQLIDAMNRLMVARGVSSARLAEAAGLSRGTMARMLAGHRAPYSSELAPIAREFGMKLSEFVVFAESGAVAL